MKLKVQLLRECDKAQIQALDEISNDDIALFFDEPGCSGFENLSLYGLFLENKLIGYCFLANIFPFQECCNYTYFDERKSFILGSVFIHPEYRKNGYGSYMVKRAIEIKTRGEKKDIYLVLSDLNTSKFYNKLGFKMFEEGFMVKHL